MIDGSVGQLLDNPIVALDKEDYCIGKKFESHNHHCSTIM